jgi:PAS domain S-box-containing protein
MEIKIPSEDQLHLETWLYSFPEKNPNPILEICLDGKIAYTNPAIRELFPTLLEQQNDHPYLANWEEIVAFIRRQPELVLEREVRVGEEYYQQSIHLVEEFQRLRVYGMKITTRKRLEAEIQESEKKYRELVQYAPAGIYEVDFRTQKFISVNEAMCLYTGYSREEMMAMGPMEFLDEPSRQLFRQRIQKWLAGEPPEKNVEFRVLGKGGREIWAELNVTFTKDEQGRPLGATVIAHDITERKRAEQALQWSNQTLQDQAEELEAQAKILQNQRIELTKANQRMKESEERFHLALKNMPVVVATLDRDFRYTWIHNPFGGFTPEEVTGKKIGIITDAESTEKTINSLQEVIRSGASVHWETTAHFKSDEKHLVSYAEPLRNQAGEITGIGMVSVDITERKIMEAALRESEGRLAQELEAARRLQEMSVQLIQTGEIQDLYEKMLTTAAMIMKSDCASLQMVDQENGAEGEVLYLLAWHGFHPQSARFWERVTLANSSACEEAFRLRKRVIIPDIEESELLAGTPDQEEYRRSGIRSVQSMPLISRSGRVIGMISTHWREPHRPSEGELRNFDILVRQVADLIERKQAEEALRLSEERERLRAAQLEAVLEALPVGVLITDERGGIAQINAAYEQVWGGKPPETHSVRDYAAYKGWWMENGKEVAPEEWASAQAVQLGKTIVGQLIKIQRFDGTIGYVFNSASPVWGADGSIIGSAVAIQDITWLQEAEQALKEANQFLEQRVQERTADLEHLMIELKNTATELQAANIDLEDAQEEQLIQNEELEDALRTETSLRKQLIQAEKYAALSRLLASVAHEINNPLQTVKNSLYLISEENPAGFMKEMLDVAIYETRRIGSLVQQLHETYQPHHQEPVEFNLMEVLSKVSTLLGPQMRQNNVQWQVHSEQERIYIHGMPDQIQQVCLNICMNAIDAMGPKGGQLTVVVSRPEKERACISFRDTGPGILEIDQAHIFEPFFTTKEKGLGLGLSICYEIVKGHGGEITVESKPGKGTAFFVCLPVK